MKVDCTETVIGFEETKMLDVDGKGEVFCEEETTEAFSLDTVDNERVKFRLE